MSIINVSLPTVNVKFANKSLQLCRAKFIPLPKRTTASADNSPRTDFDVARERLHVSAVPDSLPCREEEFSTIYEHLEASIQSGDGFCYCEWSLFQFISCPVQSN